MDDTMDPRKKQFFEMLGLARTTCDMLDFSRCINICYYATHSTKLEGEFVEMGCYSGATAALITALSGKQMYLYDSFEGLPNPDFHDKGGNKELYYRGALKSSEDDVRHRFATHMLPPPFIHKGWFGDTPPNKMPDKIAFAHVDADLYTGTCEALGLVLPNLVPNGIVVVDDFGDPAMPGVEQAVAAVCAKSEHIIAARSRGIGGWINQCVLFKR